MNMTPFAFRATGSFAFLAIAAAGCSSGETAPALLRGRVAAGSDHAVAIRPDGTLRAWGWSGVDPLGTDAGFAPLGEASSASQNTPQQIP
jgi:alpha-tubulin suppressor-like RCC1 family protein